MSTTAFGLVFVPALVAVWLGIVMGFAINSMIRGIEAGLNDRGPAPAAAGRATGAAGRRPGPASGELRGRRDEFDLLGASTRPSLWPRPWS